MSATAAIVGDSQAQGLLRPLREVLEDRLGYDLIDSRVQPGISTAVALRDGLLSGPPVDLLLVALGGNDSPNPSDPSSAQTYAGTFQSAIVVARSRARRVVWLGPAFAQNRTVNDKHLRTRALQNRYARNIEWIDSYAFTTSLPMASDGVHFTAEGYRQWANAIEYKLHFSRSTAFAINAGLGLGTAIFGAGLAFYLTR